MIIMQCEHGSFLYGTNTESSDRDYKGIFLPSINDVLLQRVKQTINHNTGNDKTKNTKDDIDEQLFSLHYFIDLACKGETVALDMIHVPPSKCIISDDIWEFIYNNRSKFYTKNMKAFLGYCQTQAAKYGVRGSRISAAKKVLNFLSEYDDNLKLGDIAHLFPKDDHITPMVVEDCKEKENRGFEVCGKKLMYSTAIKYTVKTLETFLSAYGERARLAEINEGIDWKAISHAFRAGFQLYEIYTTGDLKFPLVDAKFLTDIKMGKYHYKNDNIGKMLEDLIDEINVLAENSTYPEVVDRKFWDDFIVDYYLSEIG